VLMGRPGAMPSGHTILAREGFRHRVKDQGLGRHCERPRDEALRKKRTISADASGPAGSV
jgi:hypothetical protein